MADKLQLELLEMGGDAWNEWRRQHPYVRPDLSLTDLTGKNLRGLDLQRANLRGAQFSRFFDYRDSVFRSDYDFSDFFARGNLQGDFESMFVAADAKGAQLSDADLTGAVCRGVKFNDATLVRTRFRRANLISADLRFADLSGANLIEADLTGARAGHARLVGANLTSANLSNSAFREADFTDCIFSGTVFGGVDLSNAIGLDTCRHLGPSVIDVRTLQRSDRLPPAFSRGVGLSEGLIRRLRSLSAVASKYYSCFISYSHIDRLFARRLHDGLQTRGIRCWLDEHQILPGEEIYDKVDEGIDRWDKVLLCCSKSALTSWWVNNEITAALDKEQRLMRTRGEKVLVLIPLSLDEYLFKGWKDGKASAVKARFAADFTNWEHDKLQFETQLEQLQLALSVAEAAWRRPPKSRL